MNEESLFQSALSRPPDERSAFLDQASAGRAELRKAVAAHEHPDNILDRPRPKFELAANTEIFGIPPGDHDPQEQAVERLVTSGPPSSKRTVDLDATPGATALTASAQGRNGSLPRGTAIHYFGDYEIQGEIGRGGMGVVYRARQISLNRPVAPKMIKTVILAEDGELRRFQNEAEAVALLDHPGIVQVYEFGEYRGRRYFSFGRQTRRNGRPLAARPRLRRRERTEIDGLEGAHGRGRRDNVQLGRKTHHHRGRDRSARIGDAATGAEIQTLRGHTGDVNFVSFSRDDQQILTASQDGTARIWDADGPPEIVTRRVREFGQTWIGPNRLLVLAQRDLSPFVLRDGRSGQHRFGCRWSHSKKTLLSRRSINLFRKKIGAGDAVSSHYRHQEMVAPSAGTRHG